MQVMADWTFLKSKRPICLTHIPRPMNCFNMYDVHVFLFCFHALKLIWYSEDSLLHGQICLLPEADVFSASCWPKPDPCHNPQMQEGPPPTEQKHLEDGRFRSHMFTSFYICSLIYVNFKGIIHFLPQRARSQSPWYQYWSSAAC